MTKISSLPGLRQENTRPYLKPLAFVLKPVILLDETVRLRGLNTSPFNKEASP